MPLERPTPCRSPQLESVRDLPTYHARNLQKFAGGSEELKISRCNHARAKAQSRSAVRAEMPGYSAASGMVRPVKYRNWTRRAASESTIFNFVRASSRAIKPSYKVTVRIVGHTARSRSISQLAAELLRSRNNVFQRALQANGLCHLQRRFAFILVQKDLQLISAWRWRFTEAEE